MSPTCSNSLRLLSLTSLIYPLFLPSSPFLPPWLFLRREKEGMTRLKAEGARKENLQHRIKKSRKDHNSQRSLMFNQLWSMDANRVNTRAFHTGDMKCFTDSIIAFFVDSGSSCYARFPHCIQSFQRKSSYTPLCVGSTEREA